MFKNQSYKLSLLNTLSAHLKNNYTQESLSCLDIKLTAQVKSVIAI